MADQRISEKKERLIRRQWQERMGEYHVPENPRFASFVKDFGAYDADR